MDHIADMRESLIIRFDTSTWEWWGIDNNQLWHDLKSKPLVVDTPEYKTEKSFLLVGHISQNYQMFQLPCEDKLFGGI